MQGHFMLLQSLFSKLKWSQSHAKMCSCSVRTCRNVQEDYFIYISSKPDGLIDDWFEFEWDMSAS